MSSLVISVVSSAPMVAVWDEASARRARMQEIRLHAALLDRIPPDTEIQGTSKTNIGLKIMASGLKAQLLSLFIG